MSQQDNDAIDSIVLNGLRWKTALNSMGTYFTENGEAVRTYRQFISDKDAEFNARFTAYVVRGDWAAGVVYNRNDVVKFGVLAYAAVVTHTSTGSFANDLAGGYWTIHQGATKEELALRSGAGLVGFAQPEANAQLRDLLSKVRENRSIEDFWASGDGNDYSMAIDRANAAGIDLLMFGPKAYNFSSTLNVDDGFGVLGKTLKATRLLYHGTGSAIRVANRSGNRIRTYGQFLANFTLVGDNKTVGKGLEMDSVSEAMLQSISISTFATGHDMHSGISGGSVYNRLIGVKAQNCQVGLDWHRDDASNNSSYTSATTAVGCRANACDLGWSITGGNENALIKCQIESNVKGLYINDPTGNVSCDMNIMSMGRFEDNQTNWEVGSGARYTKFVNVDEVGANVFIDNGVATERWGGAATTNKLASRVADASGSWAFERQQNGGTQTPTVVIRETSGVGTPINLQLENPNVNPGAGYLRFKYGGTNKLTFEAPSGKMVYQSAANMPLGTFTMPNGQSSLAVANTLVTAGSYIFIQPFNINAGKIEGSPQKLYISARTPGVGFTVATSDGSSIGAAGAAFFYEIKN